MRWSLTLTLCFLLCSPLVAAQPRSKAWSYPPELPEARTEIYKRIGEVELKLYIFEPKGHAPDDMRPAIVFFFGGGWKAGTPGQFEPQCKYFASRGMVAITADYRVKDRQGVTPEECLADAKSAIRWVRQHAAKMGINPDKIVASGGSAGGHLAAATGVVPGFDESNEDANVSSLPNAMILYNPAVMLAPFRDEDLLGPEKTASIRERMRGKPEAISPIHHVKAGQPPALILHGTADEAVPLVTVERFTNEMIAVGNRCELAEFEGQSHGFFNVGRGGSEERQANDLLRYIQTTRLADDFLVSLKFLDGSATLPTTLPWSLENVQLRGHFQNARIRFERERKGHVAFLGGSITEMNGYRPMVESLLKERFPNTEFTWTNAGISSTCSTTGAFRLKEDVLDKGPVDLLFVEFAVNDDQDAMHDRQACLRGMEGIIRQVRKHNPHADIVVTFFVNPGMLKMLDAGQTPVSIGSHLEVARHYSLPTIHLARQVSDEIRAGELTWEQFGGTHPAPHGNRIAARMIDSLMTMTWGQPLTVDVQQEPHPVPPPLDPECYASGGFLDLSTAKVVRGWTLGIPDWESLPGSKRSRFTNLPMLYATEPGAELTLEFEGTAIGAYVVAGPDAGILEARIDDGTFRQVDLYHRFSGGLHYPRTVIFAHDLAPEKHTLTLKIGDAKAGASQGHAARIIHFTTNRIQAPKP